MVNEKKDADHIRYQVDTVKFIISLGTAVLFAGCGFVTLYNSTIWCVLFFAMAGLYSYIAFGLAGAFVEIGKLNVKKKMFGIAVKSFAWEQIREIGVANTKIMGKNSKSSKRNLYIYFSQKELEDDERFQMCLKWPPRECIYMKFSTKRYSLIQSKWKREIIEYNIDNLSLQ